ncbi:MAG: M4 family metallopeptidase [Candidatus Aphodosoma sp.]
MATQTILSQFICIDVVNDSLINENKTSNNSSQKANSKSNSTYVLNRYLQSNNSDFSLGDEQILYDLNNNPHYRYNILYKGIPVYNYHYTVHSAGDTLNTITGSSLFTEDVSVAPYITESEAIEVAKSLFPAQIYFWEVEELEEQIKQKSGDSLASYYPSSELVIFKAEHQLPLLAYRMELSSVSPLFSYEVFISATDASLVYKNDLMYYVSPSLGTAELHLHGEKSIHTSFDDGKYILFDQVHNVMTYDLNRDTMLSLAEIYVDDNNIWTQVEFQERDINSKNSGLVSHWASGITYDFFLNEFGRNGYDGNGSLVTIYTNYGNIFYGGKACWNNGMIIIGGGCDFVWPHHLGVLDVVAHEFAHGVTNSTANLQYYGEPGGICESISDIWAACVENYVGGRTHDQIWQMGEDMDTIMRNLSNPKSCGYPDTYNGLNWVDEKNPNGDYGGVHRKANVMNYWFYLLVNGGNGVNDNDHEYSVNGIGFDKAMKIVYNTLTLYLTPNSNFQDVREKSLLAVRNLYGNDSEEYISVMNAWYAVGVGNPYIPTAINGEFGVCDGGVYSVDNLPPMATITWSTDTYVDGLPGNQITKQKLSVVNGQNTSDIVVERSALFMQEIGAETRRYVGDVTLCATITCNGITKRIYKNLFANNKLELSCKNNLSSGLNPGHIYSYTFKVNTLPDYLVWNIEEPGKANRKIYGEQEVTLSGTTPGIIRVTVVDGGGCADYNSQTKTIINRTIEIAHKNPASYGENIQISAYVNNDDENSGFSTYSNRSKTPYPEEFVIELWSEEYGLMNRIESNSYTLELPLNGLIPGNYIIRMTSKDGIILSTSQLIINQY